MTPAPRRVCFTLACFTLIGLRAVGAQANPSPAPVSTSIAGRTTGMERRDGFLPIYLDQRQGRILLELPRDSTRALLMITQATGLGSNPIGIDRGSSGATHVARFDREGDRVLLVLENWAYRSSAGNLDHARTVAEAFPPSTVAALPLLADEGGKLLVDITDVAIRDWNDVAGTLARSQQGTYTLARDRSTVYRPYTKAFPENTEIDAALTFATTGRAGNTIESIVPDGRAFTLRQHLTFLKLPDDAYKPRVLDPRVGYFGISFKDYARPIQEPLQVRWASRHRLERVNPNDPNSPIKEPIRYYVDRGIPEPIRSATLEGVKWWEQAFDRAGLRGGFKVELLPEGVDPMDARYNVVQWENRNERGWSVGGALTDPRTGEMIKGMARLDSHRARTDYNLYAGLMGANASPADTAFVLARVRQVSAHETGHTLGLGHNYIASTYERGSLMDYPPPRVKLDAGGRIDLSQAYAVGPGTYDVWAIHWGYGIFPAASERDSLRTIVADGLKSGYLYLSDGDARPEYGSDPRVNLWDDAATPLDFLRTQNAVRRVAIKNFGERNIRPGEPIALLQERFVPVYFMHRFALNGTSKAIGGMEYSNAVRGDVQQATRPIPYQQQMAALRLMLDALRPEELAIPDTVLTLMAPGATSVTPSVELFQSRTRPAFDELGAAQTLAQMTVDMILQRDRAARLVEFATRGSGQHLTLGATIDALVTATWDAPAPATPKLAALQRVTQRTVADKLLMLAADSAAASQVRAMAELKVGDLRARARTRQSASKNDDERAHWLSIVNDFTRWIDKRELPKFSPSLIAPPGDPFGQPPA
ncbi:MAG TPA: zinc-dependent metalloprotease [Gemmatimonadaceae bacterium]|nr:zinc-dependent metalloprotease [Gemmatimonadaceae bacterium]